MFGCGQTNYVNLGFYVGLKMIRKSPSADHPSGTVTPFCVGFQPQNGRLQQGLPGQLDDGCFPKSGDRVVFSATAGAHLLETPRAGGSNNATRTADVSCFLLGFGSMSLRSPRLVLIF